MRISRSSSTKPTLSHKAGKSDPDGVQGRGDGVRDDDAVSRAAGRGAAHRPGRRNSSATCSAPQGGLEEIHCGVAALDDAYDFRTDNHGAARPLVSGRLAKALQWLGETWPGEPARVALEGRDGFLLLPVSKNFFELPGISTPLDYKAHIEPIVADMVALLATAALVRKVGQPDDVGQEAAQQ